MDLGNDNLTVKVLTTADNAGLQSTEAEIGTLKASTAAASNTFDSFNQSLGKVGATAVSTGKSMSTFITLPLVAVGAESVKMAMNFQQSMEMLHTNAGTAQADIAGLSSAILDMAGQVGQGPEALATAMYHIASAGNGIWTTAQQLNVLKIAAEGAAVGQANLDDTTYALTSTLAANVIGAKDASETMGTLLAIVGSGDMKLQDLNAAISTGLMGTLSAFGISLQSAGAALADLGDNGEQGAAAATRLRMMLTLMVSPTQAAAKELSALGLTASDAATATGTMSAVFAKTGLSTTKLASDLRQPNGISVALTDLKTHLQEAGLSADETDAILSKAFGGGKSDAALLQLLETTDRLNIKFEDINTSAGNFAGNVAAQQQTAAQQFHDAWAGVQADLIKLGDDILPQVAADFKTFGGYVHDVSNWYEGLSDSQKQFVIHAAEVLAVMGPTILIFGKLAESLSAIGKVSSATAKALGLLKLTSVATGAEAATASIAGGAGLTAALVSMAPALAAVGVAAGGAYLLWRKFEDEGKSSSNTINGYVNPAIEKYQTLAQNLGVTLKNTAGNNTLLALAQVQVANDTAMVSAATAQLSNLQQTQITNTKTVATHTQDVATAQTNVNSALTKYGANSPEYQKAVDDLSAAQSALNDQLALSIGNTLDLQDKTRQLSDAEKLLKDDTYALAGVEDYLNGKVGQTVATFANLGPTAQAQVGGIQILQGAIDNISIGWNAAVNNITIQSPAVSNILQNASYTINKLQGQSDTLNNSLHAAASSAGAIQIAGGGGIQGHATGTNYFTGGATWVGENGPELLIPPKGSQIQTATQSKNSKASGASVTNHIYVTLSTAGASSQFFKELNNDGILAGKGLSIRQGN